MSKIYLFHISLQHASQTCIGLQKKKLLNTFATTRFLIKNQFPYKLDKFLPKFLSQKLKTKSNKCININQVKLFGLYDWIETIVKHLFKLHLNHRFGDFGYNYFSNKVIKDISEKKIKIIWGYNNFSLKVFEYAKSKNIFIILDLSVGHILELEKVKNKFDPQGNLNYGITNNIISRQLAEIKIADKIIVGSKFVEKTLLKHRVSSKKIIIQNYGFSEKLFLKKDLKIRKISKNEPLKLLFVGQINTRKGADILIDVVKDFSSDKVNLTLIGNYFLEIDKKKLPQNINVINHLPHKKLKKYFYSSHAFCFPTHFEGSALTIYESIGSGLPVITTPESGHNIKNIGNFEIKSNSKKQLKNLLNKILKDKNLISKMSKNIINQYDKNKWSYYHKNIGKIIEKILVKN
jgi:glycosyltransferase involved in cell wall biosynthesis